MTTETIPDELVSFPVTITIAVMWGEMDAMQHVNNTVYFRYMETARFAYLDRLGWTAPLESGVGPILGSISCRFRFPLTYPDRVLIGSKVTSVESDRFTMRHRIVSERHGCIAAEGEGVLVAFDYPARQKALLPERIREGIDRLEREVPPAGA